MEGPRMRRPRQPRRRPARCAAARQAAGLDEQRRLQKAKGLLRAEKAGHTGTLDPLATGLLPLCFGAATKFSQVSLDADKRYRATLHLGAAHHHRRPRRRSVAERPVPDRRAPPSLLPVRASPAASTNCRPCIRRSSRRARRCTNTPAPASRSSVRRAACRFTGIDIVAGTMPSW
jgi:hypothetical protein